MSDVVVDEFTETAEPGSLMEQLRAKHEALRKARTTEIPLPGYDGLLVARYRVLDVQQEINRIGRKNALEFKDDQLAQALFGSIDAMITACVEILTTKDDERVSLSGYFGPDTPPVRYDKRLAEFMGWKDVDAARDVVMRLFDGIEPMILDHGQLLSRWMSDVTRKVNDTFAGNM